MHFDVRTTLSISVVVLVIIIIMQTNQVGIILPALNKNNGNDGNYALAKKSGESTTASPGCISCFTSLLTPEQISALERGLGVKSVQELCKQIETGEIGRADFYTAITYLTDTPLLTDVKISKCLSNNGIEFAQ